jgi:ABC-type spermidine/putrescine transport system permease subunit II
MTVRQSPAARAASGAATVVKIATILFLLGPAVVVVVLSFSNETTMTFPPRVWGIAQYRSLFTAPYWLSSIATSFSIAVP